MTTTTLMPEMSGSLAASTSQDEHRPRGRGIPFHLTVCWTCIVVAGLTGAVYTMYYDDYETSASLSKERSLAYEVFNQYSDPMFPLKQSDYWGFSFSIIGLLLAAGGGIGGGGILVPIYCLVMGFSPKHAIPLSNITIFGGAIANMMLNANKRHPLADRPLIEWDLILFMEPLTIAGALMGALLNKVLPEILLSILLVILLSFTARETLQKAFKMYKKETEENNKRLAAESARKYFAESGGDEEGIEEQGITETSVTSKDSVAVRSCEADEKTRLIQRDDEKHPVDETDLQRRRQEELEKILLEERKMPILNISILVALFVSVLSINLLKGGGAFTSPVGIKCGSTAFWMSNLFMLAFILIICLFARARLLKKFMQKERCGYQYLEGDIKWDAQATVVYPFLFCFAGSFAGMFGVGGGIVKGPLMLAMNVHPAVASASSATMILFTSFTATTSFLVFGLLIPDYAVVCCIIGFLSTWVGQVGLTYLMKKSKRNSYIAFSIGGVVLVSAFLMTIQSFSSMAEIGKHPPGGICGNGV